MYRHTQTGWLMIGVFAALLPLELAIARSCGQPGPILALVLVLALIFSQFFWMTVVVRDGRVVILSGTGHFSKTVDLVDVASAEPVRNRWWYGWGIRCLGFGLNGAKPGWLINVSGLDAVELTYKDGGVLRIGTDEPMILTDAIQAELEKVHGPVTVP